MKLKSCYIDNFGKLSDYSFDFSSALNTVREDNGYGKSTLIAFIKAMLFGLEDTKKTKLDENERKKYEPWQGGAWGGSLSFTALGRDFRVERRFSKKASSDECTVYDDNTGKPLPEYSQNLGEMIFGIDREGFERTVFLSEKSISEKCENKTIAAKLSDLSGVEGDISVLDDALSILEDERKYYFKQGGGGAIGELDTKITKLEIRKRELEALRVLYDADTKRINAAEHELAQLKKLERAQKSAEEKRKIQKELYASYLSKREEYEKESVKLKELQLFFKNGYPEKQELYQAISAENELKRLYAMTSLDESNEIAVTIDDVQSAESLTRQIDEKQAKLNELNLKKIDTGRGISQNKILFFSISALLFILAFITGLLISPLFFALTLPAIIIFLYPLFKSKNSSESLIKDIEEKELELHKLSLEIKKIKEKFGCEKNLSNANFLRELRESFDMQRRECERSHELSERIKAEEEKFISFAKRYPTVSNNPLNEIAEKLAEAELSTALITRLKAECLELQEKYSFDNGDMECKDNFNENEGLEQNIKEQERALLILMSKHRNDELALDELDEISAECERLKLSADEYRHRLAIVKKTKSFLEAAKDNMNSRYLGKTKTAFLKYAQIISRRSEDFSLDTSFSITKREGGISKPRDAYSKATRELYAFALRLALIDTLYQEEKPFIILDDPFAFYDDDKLARALSLLKELSLERQIIYMTASKSRA